MRNLRSPVRSYLADYREFSTCRVDEGSGVGWLEKVENQNFGFFENESTIVRGSSTPLLYAIGVGIFENCQQVGIGKQPLLSGKSAEWTHQLLPNLIPYIDNLPSHDFFLSQALSGHGCFASFLHTRRRKLDPRCSCGERQSPLHVFCECPRFK